MPSTNEERQQLVPLSKEEHNMFCSMIESSLHTKVFDKMLPFEIKEGCKIGRNFDSLNIRPPKMRYEYSSYAFTDEGHVMSDNTFVHKLYKLLSFSITPNKYGGAVYITEDTENVFDLNDARAMIAAVATGPWLLDSNRLWLSNATDAQMIKNWF
tara:strand:+ start:623 stop:1087 length:465 start_codon:yes stop_codon:yes gene_type:complete